MNPITHGIATVLIIWGSYSLGKYLAKRFPWKR
jgi:hypothetical protein